MCSYRITKKLEAKPHIELIEYVYSLNDKA